MKGSTGAMEIKGLEQGDCADKQECRKIIWTEEDSWAFIHL